ncbi:PREDICTED: angiotensin-converting enzyme-like [Nicrophorus vespilloides]|uniref:Angiotensin-converting enzyme-like n=1 Tax=Nicrophorus vespilloides TaxID=110193 RepID=A0ABM1N2K3_NICVS|nr:PREDICTED: angiotensin-converting enzyme-like [Nicrophorus vespilloides]
MRIHSTMKTVLVLGLAVCLWTAIVAQEEDENFERLSSELKLIKWDLEDECSDIADSIKEFHLDIVNSLHNKIVMETTHAKFIREQSPKLMKFEDNVHYDLEKTWNLLIKPGDLLLSNEDYKKLSEFANANLMRKKNQGYSIEKSKDADKLEEMWMVKWENVSTAEEYPSILGLVNKAAQLNQQYDAKSYWEMLTEIDNAFGKAEELWNEIAPLHEKLKNFVLVRLNKHYGTNFTDHIPAYLIEPGDWSSLADIVLPHPQMLNDVNTELLDKGIRNSFKSAEGFTKAIGLGRFGKKFWLESKFDLTACEKRAVGLHFCTDNTAEVLTCNRSTLVSHVGAYELGTDLMVKRIGSRPLRNLRYSSAEETLVSLSSLLSMQNLPSDGLLDDKYFEKEINRKTALLLTALKVLPALAYYRAADVWRLEELQSPSGDIQDSWWKNREQFEGVSSYGNKFADFLDDEEILYNKPYISKFLAKFLQFQLLNYYQINLFQDSTNVAKKFQNDATFKDMLEDLPNRDSLDLLSYHFSIDDVSAYPFQEFFYSLEEYLDNAPLHQAPIVMTTKAPKVAKKHLPATTTSTTTTTTTTKKPDAVKPNLSPDLIEEDIKQATGSGTYMGGFLVTCAVLLVVGIIIWKMKKRKPNRPQNRRDEV